MVAINKIPYAQHIDTYYILTPSIDIIINTQKPQNQCLPMQITLSYPDPNPESEELLLAKVSADSLLTKVVDDYSPFATLRISLFLARNVLWAFRF